MTLAMLASAARALVRQMKSPVLVSVLALAAFAVLEETALARSYLSCLAKKVVIVDAPKGTTSSSAEENFGFWIDEPTKIVTFADGKKLNVCRFDDHWISAVSGDVSYELDRQNGRTKKELPHRAPKRILASGLMSRQKLSRSRMGRSSMSAALMTTGSAL